MIISLNESDQFPYLLYRFGVVDSFCCWLLVYYIGGSCWQKSSLTLDVAEPW